MKRSGPIDRKPWTPKSWWKRLRKKNPARAKKRREEAYGEYAERYVRGWPCDVPGCGKPSVPAHAAKTRGAGGKAHDLNRLCPQHEEKFHAMGRKSFETLHWSRVGVLRELADARWEEWTASRKESER